MKYSSAIKRESNPSNTNVGRGSPWKVLKTLVTLFAFEVGNLHDKRHSWEREFAEHSFEHFKYL